VAFFLITKYACSLPFHRQGKVVTRMDIEVATT